MKSKLRLLIVEDDADQRHLIGKAAERSGKFSSVQTAPDGKVALEMLAAAHGPNRQLFPDLILSDLDMPGIDGLAFIRAVKARPEVSHIPIAVLTSSSSPEARDQAFDAGCSAFFSKPTQFTELTALLTRAPSICGVCV